VMGIVRDCDPNFRGINASCVRGILGPIAPCRTINFRSFSDKLNLFPLEAD
jgi:hypothetical protein